MMKIEVRLFSPFIGANTVADKAFNPYHQWLELPPELTAPNYYQLCGLAAFESDQEKIRAAVERSVVKVRSFRPGAHAAQWSRLLDELAAAKETLANPEKKAAYDQKLRTGAIAKPSSSTRNSQPAEPVLEVAAVNRDPNLYPPGMEPQKEKKPRVKKSHHARKSPTGSNATAERNGRAQVAGKGASKHAKVSAASQQAAAKSTTSKNRLKPQTPQHTSTDEKSSTARPSDGRVPTPARKQRRGKQDAPISLADPPAELHPVNAHVAPPPQPHSSIWPIAIGVAAVIVLLTLGIFYLAISGAG